MSKRAPKWNKHEAVILLDGLLEVLNDSAPRKEIIKRVSQDLREMGRHRGENVDDIFRNENGISLQMSSMESAVKGYNVGIPTTKLFTEVANIYRENRTEYDRLLADARTMVNGTESCEANFTDWLSKKVPPENLPELFLRYAEIETSCIDAEILERPLFETTDCGSIYKVLQYIEQNKLFRTLHSRQLDSLLEAGRYYYIFVREIARKDMNFEKFNSETQERIAEDPTMTKNQSTNQNLNGILFTRSNEDERLLTKYPIIYKRVFSKLQDYQDVKKGATVKEIQDSIQRIGRASDIEEILDNASWSKNVNGKYVFLEEVITYDDKKQKENLGERIDVKKVDRTSFYNYLLKTQNLSRATSMNYSTAIERCEKFAKEHHYNSWKLYTPIYNEAKATVDLLCEDQEFLELDVQGHRQLRSAIKKLLSFIGDDNGNDAVSNEVSPASSLNRKHTYSNKRYETVLRENFRKGFRLNSPIEIRRFRKSYKDIYGREPKENDEKVEGIIVKLCITYKNMAYLPEEMLSEGVKEKLFAYIEDNFNKGKTNIYFQAMCTEFEDDFLDYPLYKAPEALKAYLTSMGDGRFYVNRSSISRSPNMTTDPLEEIRSCLKEYDRPISFEELFSELSHLPQRKIKHILSSNEEFVRNSKGSYFHESILRISNEDLENIARIIEQAIEDKDFIGGNELYEAIQVKYPYIVEDNSKITSLGFRDALKYKLGDRYSFKGNIISDSGRELCLTDVFANYARNHESFMLAELEALAKELDSPIYFEPVYENSLRVSQEQFVSKLQAKFNVVDTDRALDLECPENYVAICRVKNFGIFPDAGFPWNSFILEHYVAAYSKKFRLMHAGFNKTICAGAIVRKSVGIDNFDDFIVQLLLDTNTELKKETILKFLKDEGYLAKQRYSNIEQLILRAKAQKNRGEQK